MSTHSLTTPREADALIARMFEFDRTCCILVREEKAFKSGNWLPLGEIAIESGVQASDQMLAAVRRGAFEWNLPGLNTVRADLCTSLGVTDDQKTSSKLRRSLDAMAAIAVRVGLQYPKFDPYSLEAMPFRRSTTVVADTSGAIQGGLDFVARYLHPAARVKVPAIVQMEIVNFAERFLIGRRASKTKSMDLLNDHLMSQGGQRVLLRLELHADTEIERNFLLGDPLRSAFQSDRDSELNELNLSVPIRAYADRLILEAARQHQAQANLGHKVQLLTSDQGLARMALAEGITPLFFTAVKAEDLFEQKLTGTTLDPFTGVLREIPIASLIWELATAFGCAKLESRDRSHCLVVSAIGEGLSWSPYQSHADLLWCDEQALPQSATQATRSIYEENTKKKVKVKDRPKNDPLPERGASSSAIAAKTKVSGVSLPRLNVGRLFALIDALDSNQRMSIPHITEVLSALNSDGLDDYRRFLTSAGLIAIESDAWSATRELSDLAIALRNEDIEGARKNLLSAPSFALFFQRISDLPIGQVWMPNEFARTATTYRTLGEVTCICAPIFNEGLYPTPSIPDLASFASIAIQRFRDLDQGDGLVATGTWLEDLVRKDGIHPEIAKRRLHDASAKGLLRRSTEGSTTEVRFDNHIIQVLRVHAGKPIVEKIHLYRGDYLIPGKSSTSLRIEGPNK